VEVSGTILGGISQVGNGCLLRRVVFERVPGRLGSRPWPSRPCSTSSTRTIELPPLDDLVRTAAAGDTSSTRMAGGACWRPRNVTGWWRGCGRCARNLLCEVITPESAPDTLELARRHGRPELKAFSSASTTCRRRASSWCSAA
jgi:hypothetical protein